MVFGRSDLRVHKDWVEGKWVRPQKQQKMRELSFSEGAAVEVNIDEESSRDIWFPATVIERIGNGSFLVEYQSSNEAGFVKVVVDSLHIRPPPPSYSNRDIQLLEKVDAFYGFGWSSGVVTKVLGDGRYIVFFKRTRKEKELSHMDLRLHMEWMDCEWVNPSLEHQPVGCIEKSPADIMTTSNKRIMQIGRNNTSNGTPTKNANGETVPDASLLPEAYQLKTPQTSSSNSERPTYSSTPTTVQTGTASSEKLEGTNQLFAKSMTHGNKIVEAEGNKYGSPENEKSEVTRKRGRPPKPVLKTPQAVVADGAAVSTVVDKGGMDGWPIIQPAKEVIIGLTCYREGKTSKDESTRCMKFMQDEKSWADVKANHGITQSKQQEDVGSSTPKRKRGRPPKLQDGSQKATGPGKDQNSAGADASQNDGRHSTANEALLHTVKAIEPVGASVSIPSESHRQKLVNLIEEQTKPWSIGRRQNMRHTVRRRGKKTRKIMNETFGTAVDEQAKQHVPKKPQSRKITVEIESPNQDFQDALGVIATLIPANTVQDAQPSVARISSTVSDDDRPLSTWFEGPQPSPKMDEARGPPGSTVSQYNEINESQDKVKTSVSDQCKEAKAKQIKTTTQNVNRGGEDAGGRVEKMVIDSAATVPTYRNLTEFGENLPFSKSSLIWKTIESMEVFKVMPQRPHFHPLYDCKEECREGLAIGNMVTFASLVDKVTKFQFDGHKSILESNMEILADLEKQGFDVEVIRSRLGALLSIKGRHERAENSVKDIRNQIADQTREKSKIEEEIEDIDKKILELNEKRRLAVALEEQMDSEIAVLESSVDAIKESMESSRAEFERIAAATW
ncbi:hypothetical protein Ancab_022526 [Ancistrocladus abbreviatus]